MVNNWHLIHYGSRAAGGVGLIVIEATAVDPAGRLTPSDLGIWNDAQAAAFRPIVDFVHEMGGVAAIQMAHGGRKSSGVPPWEGNKIATPERGVAAGLWTQPEIKTVCD